MKLYRILAVVSCLSMAMVGAVYSQNTGHYENPEYGFSQAVRLYENGKFAAAKQAFSAVQRDLQEDEAHMRSEAMYYKAMCDVMLYHKSGAKALREFVEAYPNSNRVNSAYFRLANFEYEYKRYGDACSYFEKVNPNDLDAKDGETELFYFRSGYSFFMKREPYKTSRFSCNRYLNIRTISSGSYSKSAS